MHLSLLVPFPTPSWGQKRCNTTPPSILGFFFKHEGAARNVSRLSLSTNPLVCKRKNGKMALSEVKSWISLVVYFFFFFQHRDKRETVTSKQTSTRYLKWAVCLSWLRRTTQKGIWGFSCKLDHSLLWAGLMSGWICPCLQLFKVSQSRWHLPL